MPSILRSRLALFALMGIFLIPIGTSSLRGLTHVLTCRDAVEQPFTLVVPPNGPPELLSSLRITREKPEKLCGGLTMDARVSAAGEGKIAFELPIKNSTEFVWRGTVKLQLGQTSIPVDIGEIAAGDTESDTVTFDLDEGTHEVDGSLLIGP